MLYKTYRLFVLLFSIYILNTSATIDSTQNTNYSSPTNIIGDALFITPYIHNGDIEKAQKLAYVGYEEINKIASSYSGYFTVNETYESNMFFWYFPAKVNPETAPVLLWLQGGPGSPSTFGLFYENGPFTINEQGKLNRREYSWHINHHLIYLDNPVGTGFSFTKNDAGYARNEVDIGNNLYEAVKQFFLLFPNLQSHKFYISGESYAGKYIPALGYTILTRNSNDLPKINLDGLLIGNPLIDPINQMNYGDYLYQLGLIDNNVKKIFAEYNSRIIKCINQKDLKCAYKLFTEMVNTDAATDPSLYYKYTGLKSYYNYVSEYSGKEPALRTFLTSNEIRHALHVGNTEYHELGPSNIVGKYLDADIMDSVANFVNELLSNYRVLIYNGQLDVICAYPLLQNAIKNFNFSGSVEYFEARRNIWRVDLNIAGYIKQGGNLTTVLVRNSGHMVPRDQPQWALNLIRKFIENNFVDLN